MSYSVTFNGVELNNYINVLVGFTPYIGADWQPSIVDYNGIMDGESSNTQSLEPKPSRCLF